MAHVWKKNQRGDIIAMPGVALARNIPHFQAVQEFGKRMLDSQGLLNLLKDSCNVSRFIDSLFIACNQDGAHLRDLVVLSKEPLGAYMKNGVFTYSSCYRDEDRQIIIDEHRLRCSGADLDKPNQFMVIKGGYSIHNEGWFSFSIDFPKEIGSLKPFLDFRQDFGKDGWFEESGTNIRAIRIVSPFGPVRLEKSLPFSGSFYGTYIYVGGRFSVRREVFYLDNGQ